MACLISMKLYDMVQNEDGTVKVETELTPEEMRALLQLGVMACIQNGVMVASLAHHFGGGTPIQEEQEMDAEWQTIIDSASEYQGIGYDPKELENNEGEKNNND